VTIEVDGPTGEPMVLATVPVPSDEGPVSLEFTLPSDCEPGTYDVFVCNPGPMGEGERHAGTFVVVLAEEVPDPPFPTAAAVGMGAGGAALAAAAIVATGDASKYRFFAAVAPLFTRLREDDVLTHEVRWKILGFVTENPGEAYNHIRRELELPNGSLSYHLQVLERAGRVRCVRDGRYARFFTPDALRRGYPSRVLSDIEGRIIETILDNPRISQKEIALLLDEKPENVGYHLRKMVRAGWIDSYTRGRETHYDLTTMEGNELDDLDFESHRGD
jgi:DNA-binding MarR family transcriptional regulator